MRLATSILAGFAISASLLGPVAAQVLDVACFAELIAEAAAAANAGDVDGAAAT